MHIGHFMMSRLPRKRGRRSQWLEGARSSALHLNEANGAAFNLIAIATATSLTANNPLDATIGSHHARLVSNTAMPYRPLMQTVAETPVLIR